MLHFGMQTKNLEKQSKYLLLDEMLSDKKLCLNDEYSCINYCKTCPKLLVD